jgi:hypothetical protein
MQKNYTQLLCKEMIPLHNDAFAQLNVLLNIHL